MADDRGGNTCPYTSSGRDQADLARTFSTGGTDRFATPISWRPGPYGVPLLDGAPAWLIWRIAERFADDDRTIMLA